MTPPKPSDRDMELAKQITNDPWGHIAADVVEAVAQAISIAREEGIEEISRLKSEVERLNFVATNYMNEMHRLAGINEHLRREKERLVDFLDDIHDIAFDGDGLKTAKELGKDISQMIKKVLSDLKAND